MFKNFCGFLGKKFQGLFKKFQGLFKKNVPGSLIVKTKQVKVYKQIDDLANIKFTTINRKTGKVVQTLETFPIENGGFWKNNKYYTGPQHVTKVTRNGEVVRQTVVTDLSNNSALSANKAVVSVSNPGKNNQMAQLIEVSPTSVSINRSLPNNHNTFSLYNKSGDTYVLAATSRSRVNVLSSTRMAV